MFHAKSGPRAALGRARSRSEKNASVAFDAAYFRRYYGSARSRVYGPEEIDHLARGVTGLVRWFGCDIERVLDVGAGTGLWGDWLRANMPSVEYTSIDASEYACVKYGHRRLDIARWKSRARFDLVVCQGVLPYLTNAECARAVANMRAMCRGFLYLEAITSRDLREACDRSRTDSRVIARPASFYRRALARHFEPLGCGLHHVRGGDRLFYELERG
jgi:methyltransferase family protein